MRLSGWRQSGRDERVATGCECSDLRLERIALTGSGTGFAFGLSIDLTMGSL